VRLCLTGSWRRIESAFAANKFPRVSANSTATPPLSALEGMIIADTQRQISARLRQEVRQFEVVAECVKCQTQFPVWDFHLRVAVFEQMISIDHGPDVTAEGGMIAPPEREERWYPLR
jgi:hypothetical protein